jgi:hypothetical protein
MEEIVVMHCQAMGKEDLEGLACAVVRSLVVWINVNAIITCSYDL